MESENGTAVEKEQEKPTGIILSDTTQKIIDVIKQLEGAMKSMTRQEQYHARGAVNSLKMLVASKVVG